MTSTKTPAELAAELVRRYGLTAADLVIEVGSGDGALLRAVRDLGPRVLGVEPDVRAMARAWQAGVDTVSAFFTPVTAGYVRRRYGAARVLVAHAAPSAGLPPEFVAAAAACLAPDGVTALLHESIFAEVRPTPLARAA